MDRGGRRRGRSLLSGAVLPDHLEMTTTVVPAAGFLGSLDLLEVSVGGPVLHVRLARSPRLIGVARMTDLMMAGRVARW
jgi:hypothetical protein